MDIGADDTSVLVPRKRKKAGEFSKITLDRPTKVRRGYGQFMITVFVGRTSLTVLAHAACYA